MRGISSLKRSLDWTVCLYILFPLLSPRDRTYISCVSCIAGGFFTTEPPRKPPFSSTWTWSLLILSVLCPTYGSWSSTHWCNSGAQSQLRSVVRVQGSCQSRKHSGGCTCKPSLFCLHRHGAQLLLIFPADKNCLPTFYALLLSCLICNDFMQPKWMFLHLCPCSRSKSKMNITSLQD